MMGNTTVTLEIETLKKAAKLLKTIAHPVRLDIVQFLGDQEHAVKDIQMATGKPQAVISQHLRLMRDRGVLTSRREGVTIYHSVAHPFVLHILNCMYTCAQKMDL